MSRSNIFLVFFFILIQNVRNELSEDLEQFNKEALEWHNYFRSAHLTQALKINQDLVSIAQKESERLALNDQNEKISPLYKGNRLGQNLFASSGINDFSAADMCKIWYKSIVNYDFENPEFNNSSGMFTQMIWNNTSEVGFGKARSKQGNTYYVALYYPSGNIISQFKQNVFPTVYSDNRTNNTLADTTTATTTSKITTQKSISKLELPDEVIRSIKTLYEFWLKNNN